MSDIDFDELDKAVNNLMQETTADETPSVTTPLQPQTTPISGQVSQEKVPLPGDTAVKVSDRPQAPSAPVVRRRGQFMDIVAPQSSKKPTPTVSRQALDIAPVHDDIVAEAPAPAPSPLDMSALDPKEETGTQSMPDPIDFTGKDTEEPIEPSEVSEVQDESTPSTPVMEVETTDAEETSEQPLSSPFLPDAKVEKRPLGSPAPLSLDTLGPELQKEKDETDLSAAEMPAEPSMNTAMPDEFHPELATIDAEATSQPTPSAEIEEKAISADETPLANNTSLPVSEKAQDAPAVPASIPQQYEEKPSTYDPENGSIYDTSEYHQPLQHPDKKKSGMWIVVMILACVLLGSALAALYYYFVMAR